MFRNAVAFFLFLVVSISNVEMIEAALQIGDIVYRTSKDGYMYGYNGTSTLMLGRPGHNGIYVGDEYVVEATGWPFVNIGKVEMNLLSKFVDSSEGQIYIGAKTTINEPDSERRGTIAINALDQVGEGYDNNWTTQKGPGNNEWTCVGLTEKVYESADTPNELQYHESYDCYCGTGTYALDITTDGVDNNNSFSTKLEKSEVTWFKKNIFFPYTQYVQNTLKDVITDYPVSDNFHTLTAPSKTKVSQGSILGPFTIEESNNSDFYYGYYVQPYVTNPDGTTVNFKQVSTGLKAGETRTHSHYLSIPSWSELGTFTYGVKITDTKGNLIDDDSFEFTVVSGSSYASKRSERRLKRLLRKLDMQLLEEDGWKTINVPEKNK